MTLSQRHDDLPPRVGLALEYRGRLERWVHSHYGNLTVRLGGRHWRIQFGALSIDWYPETGRLIRSNEAVVPPHRAADVEELIEKVAEWVPARRSR